MPFLVCLVLGIPKSSETSVSIPTDSTDTPLLKEGYSILFWTHFKLLNLTANIFVFVLLRSTETLWTISSCSWKKVCASVVRMQTFQTGFRVDCRTRLRSLMALKEVLPAPVKIPVCCQFEECCSGWQRAEAIQTLPFGYSCKSTSG